MNTILRELRFSLRKLVKDFGLSTTIILSIGLGIGLNTTIFSLLNVVLLRPLPGAHAPGQLVEVYTSYTSGLRFGAASYPDYKDWRDQNRAFSGLLAQSLVPVNLRMRDQNVIVSGALVSANYFSVLGVKPFNGRLFQATDDDTAGSHPEVVLGHGLWVREFGSDAEIIGRTIHVNAQSFTVIGIAPPEFTGANVGLSVDLWVPLAMQSAILPGDDRLQARGSRWLDVIGRLNPGVALPQARAMLAPMVAQLAERFPGTNHGTGVNVVAVGQGPAGVQSFILPVVELLMVVVLLILLIACFNVTNLLLSRSSSRQGEIAVRLAMGASRIDILRLLLTESLVLALFAGAFAMLLAYGSIMLLGLFRPPTSVPIFLGLTLDGRVMGFTLLLSLAAGFVFGVIPALRTAKLDLLPMLRTEGVRQGYRKSKLRNSLVVVQIAISLFLLVGAGLILRSLQFVQKIDPGFKPDNMVIASLNVGLAGYDSAKGSNLYQRILERVETVPGVRSASMAEAVPMEIETTRQMGMFVRGYEAPNHRAISIDYNVVAPHYFRTMEIPLMEGRDFREEDKTGAQGVAIVNEAFARRFWPGDDPIGKTLSISGREGPYLQVVGLARNSKYYNVREKAFPFLYLPFYQVYRPGMVLHVSTLTDPSSAIASIQREVQSFDPSLPIFHVRTLKEHLGLSLIELRAAALFLGIFGGLALVLASIGLYGVVAYSTDKRKPEIAIRMAVGARSADVLKLIRKEGLLLTGIGLVFGVIVTFAAGRLLSFLLVGVNPADPITISSVALLLLIVSFFATLIPAWKATRNEPMNVLRS
jgi:predicted permease